MKRISKRTQLRIHSQQTMVLLFRAGDWGPTCQKILFCVKVTHFDHERIPENTLASMQPAP